jgi:hypothetical protein
MSTRALRVPVFVAGNVFYILVFLRVRLVRRFPRTFRAKGSKVLTRDFELAFEADEFFHFFVGGGVGVDVAAADFFDVVVFVCGLPAA